MLTWQQPLQQAWSSTQDNQQQQQQAKTAAAAAMQQWLLQAGSSSSSSSSGAVLATWQVRQGAAVGKDQCLMTHSTTPALGLRWFPVFVYTPVVGPAMLRLTPRDNTSF
jgi:hypothetical protein